MRDYWLTREVLSLIGISFWILVCIGVALALWIPRRWIVKASGVAVVLALAAIPVHRAQVEHAENVRKAEEWKARFTKAKALFDERCKEAGEFITRKDSVEGVVWMRWRSSMAREGYEPVQDPYGNDCSDEECIYRLLRGSSATLTTPSLMRKEGAFGYVETIDPRDLVKYRYTGKVTHFTEVDEETLRKNNRITGTGTSNGLFLLIRRQPISSFSARYGLLWDETTTDEERANSIAGSSLKVIDLKTNQPIATRIGYIFDRGFGSKAGFRSPWSWTRTYGPRCPEVIVPTWDFASQVLNARN